MKLSFKRRALLLRRDALLKANLIVLFRFLLTDFQFDLLPAFVRNRLLLLPTGSNRVAGFPVERSASEVYLSLFLY